MVAAGLLAAVVAPAAAGSGESPGDGDWIGFLRYDGSATFTSPDGDVNADYNGAGGFAVTVSGGSATGDYGFNVDVALPDLDATAAGAGTGVVGGPVTEMTLKLDTLAVSEPTLGMAFTFTAAELGNPTGVLVTTSTSCDMMEGTWNHEFDAGVASTGGSTSGLGGTWTGLRMDDGGDADAARERMALLQAEADAVLTSFASGDLPLRELRDFLSSAEAAAASLPRGDCDRSSADMRHLGAFVVDTVLREASTYLDDLLIEELLELIRSGTRTGTFAADDDLRSAYESHLAFLATEAAAEGDVWMLERLLAAARMAGWSDTAAAIEELLEEAS